MRHLVLLPLLATLCMGAKLPATGPLPAENPRSAAGKRDAAPVPSARPENSTSREAPSSSDSPAAAVQTRDPASPTPPTGRSGKLPGISAPTKNKAQLAGCEAELRKLGAVFDRKDPIRGENGCGIEAPYSIEEIVPGISLSPASQLRCQTALAMARWMDAVVVPAAEALPDDVTLARVNHGSTYVCRRRNNSATGKMSEHAIGNAIDIMSFEFEGRDPIPVSPRAGDGTVEEAFQRAVRGGACLHFTTVLGPGSNASHADHLHLDIIKRKRGYRLCE